MVVLAIITILLLGAMFSFIAVRRAHLRRDANRVAGALRYTFDRARATGKDHRMVFELDPDETRYWIEISEEGGAMVGKDITASARMLEEELKLEEDKELFGNAAMDEGLSEREIGIKRAPLPKWRAYQSELAPKRVLERSRISSIYIARLDETITQGRAHLYFWGNGQTERAIIHVNDRENRVYSLVTHPLTGRVKVYQGIKEAHPREMLTDDEGLRIHDR